MLYGPGLGLGVRVQNNTREEESCEFSCKREIAEMCRVKPQKLNYSKNGDRKGQGKGKKKRKGRGMVVDGDYCCSPNWGLKGDVENAMLASQEIQGPPTPAKIHDSSVTAANKEKKKVKNEQQQDPGMKSSILFFTTHTKTRLRWTPKLHARFVDAINELGGAHKATPKPIRISMAVEGLNLYHVKSHLQTTNTRYIQKYRMGKVTVKEWPKVPKSFYHASSGGKIGNSKHRVLFQAYGPRRNKLKKTCKVKGDVWANLFPKIQKPNYGKHLKEVVQEAEKELDEIRNGGADVDVAGSFHQDLVRERTLAETPSSIQESIYLEHTILERIEQHLNLRNQISSSASYQLQDVAQSATGCFMTLQGDSYPEHISSDAVNVHLGLQGKAPSFLSQNETWGAVPGCQPNIVAYGFQLQNAGYPSPNHFPTSNGNSSERTAYMQDFHPKSADYSFQPQDLSYYYQPQTAATEYPPQDAAYGYQVSNAAYSATTDLQSENRNYSETAFLDDLTVALATIGSINLASLLDDMDCNYPETSNQDNGLSFTKHWETQATQYERAK